MITSGLEWLKEELEARDSVVDVRLDLRRPVRASVVEHIAEERGVVPPAALLELLSVSNGFRLSWRYKPRVVEEFMSATVPGGEIHLPSLVEMYSLPTQDVLWFPEMGEQGSDGPRYLAFCQGLRVFENLLGSTESVFVVQSPTWPGSAASPREPRLLYWDTKGGKYLLSLSVGEYLVAAVEAKGFSGWQCFYVDKAGMEANGSFCAEYLARNLDGAAVQRRRFLETMPWLFPGVDFSRFAALDALLS